MAGSHYYQVFYAVRVRLSFGSSEQKAGRANFFWRDVGPYGDPMFFEGASDNNTGGLLFEHQSEQNETTATYPETLGPCHEIIIHYLPK